jgi:hypothetical protein
MQTDVRFVMYRRCLILAVTFFYACEKDSRDEYQGTATIIGFDTRMGPCVGGRFISIDNHPNPNGGYFNINTMPESFKIDSYPLKVKLDWKINDKCSGNFVDITRIKEVHF